MKKPLLLLCLAVLFISTRIFSQCNPSTPTSGNSFSFDPAVGTLGWTGVNNADASDNSYATAGQLIGILSSVQTQYITATNFGFSIPASAMICGIKVEVERHAGGLIIGSSIVDNSVRIIKNGTLTGPNMAAGGGWTGSDVLAGYGGGLNQWGTTWVPADVNNANFGVAFSAKLNAGLAGVFLTAFVDDIKITVYYDFLLPDGPVDFKADAEYSGIRLSWSATAGSQTRYYLVEKSTDAHTWNRLDSVNEVIGGKAAAGYQSFDAQPAPVNYYRLQHADNDGPLSLDYTVFARFSKATHSGLRVYTNVTSRNAVIECDETIRSIQLLDTHLRQVHTEYVEGAANKTVVNTSGLAPGIYVAKVATATNKVYAGRVMVW
jgi:hypothetical protein